MPHVTWVLKPDQDIICTINIQYDCPAFGCNLTSLVVEKQECILTLWVKTFVEHASMNIYVINMSSIHNYQWIKAAIPSVLYNKIYMPLILDLNCLHAEAAQVLQSKKDGKLVGDFKMSHEPSSMEPDLSQPKKRQLICGNGKGNGKAQTNAKSVQSHAAPLNPQPSSSFSSHPAPVYTHSGTSNPSLWYQPFIPVPSDPHPLSMPYQPIPTYLMHPAYVPLHTTQSPQVGTSFSHPYQPPNPGPTSLASSSSLHQITCSYPTSRYYSNFM